MANECDLAVIGAGPAGIAAACLAADLGLSVVVLDEQGEPGGQIYRAIETARTVRPNMLDHLGRDYACGGSLVDRFRSSGVAYMPDAFVWDVGRDRVVNYSRGGRSQALRARHVLVATGAVERPVPIPGWTKPGVLTVGALQILLKAQGLAPDGRVVLAGSGPLLLLLAAQYAAVGIAPASIVETVPRGRYLTAAPKLLSALRTPGYLRKGIEMMRAVRSAGVPIYRGATGLRIEGHHKAEALVFMKGGREHRVAADVFALHQGVVPNQQITRALGCDHDWDEAQRCFRPRLDEWFGTSIEGVSAAGDGGGIGGAKAAEIRGRLAALGIATRLGALDIENRDRRALADRAALSRDLAIRPLLDTLYTPTVEFLTPADDVTICRCEEVTAGAIRRAVQLGCPGPNQAKSFLRCGMGPCQGRVCGLVVTEIIAAERNLGPREIGYYRIRPPLKPLTLGELAALDEDAELTG